MDRQKDKELYKESNNTINNTPCKIKSQKQTNTKRSKHLPVIKTDLRTTHR